MDEKWLKNAYQFDDDLSGGGDDPPPAEPLGDIGEPPADPSGDVPVVPDPTPPPEPGPVAKPQDFDALFAPPAPTGPPTGPQWQPPPGQPPAGPEPPAAPPRVDFPDADAWIDDPAKAAKQQADALAYNNYMQTQPLRDAISDIQSSMRRSQHESFEQTVQRVEGAIGATAKAMDRFYDEAGPLNADKEFRNNPDLQSSVKNVIKEVVRHAINKAETTGDTSSLERITNDPKFPYRVLALAKADAQTIPEDPLRPTRSPVGPQPPQPPEDRAISKEDAEALAAARADGVDITAEQIKRAREITKRSIY